jgi:hypothetical protein
MDDVSARVQLQASATNSIHRVFLFAADPRRAYHGIGKSPTA